MSSLSKPIRMWHTHLNSLYFRDHPETPIPPIKSFPFTNHPKPNLGPMYTWRKNLWLIEIDLFQYERFAFRSPSFKIPSLFIVPIRRQSSWRKCGGNTIQSQEQFKEYKVIKISPDSYEYDYYPQIPRNWSWFWRTIFSTEIW
jgi:hypothetical protein